MNTPPRLLVEPGRIVLGGAWTLAAMLPELSALQRGLAGAGNNVLPCSKHGQTSLTAP